MNFDILTLRVVSESRVTWATSVPILVFLGLSVLDLGLTDVRRQITSSLSAPTYVFTSLNLKSTAQNLEHN